MGRVALAASGSNTHGRAERGQLLQLGVERSTSQGSGALQYEHASQGFAPFGEAADPVAPTQRARSRWLASLGGTVWGPVSGGLSYVSQRLWSGAQVKTAGASISLPLGQSSASLTVSLNRRLDGDRAWRAGLGISMPLDNGVSASSRVETARGSRATGGVSASRSPPAGPGMGWRVEGSTQESQRARGSVQYNTSQAEFMGDAASNAAGQAALRAGARGTLGLLAGMPFASRAVGRGSFALVNAGGLAGVPVMRSHQVVARTDSRGLAFVPGLLPWQPNQIEIDLVDFPLDVDVDVEVEVEVEVEVGNVVQQVTPYPGSGSVVVFSVRRTRQALVVLHQPGGQPVPVGAQVRLLPGGPEFRVGRRGEVWLTDLAAAHQPLRASWSGGGCRLALRVPSAQDMPPKIGPLACEKD